MQPALTQGLPYAVTNGSPLFRTVLDMECSVCRVGINGDLRGKPRFLAHAIGIHCLAICVRSAIIDHDYADIVATCSGIIMRWIGIVGITAIPEIPTDGSVRRGTGVTEHYGVVTAARITEVVDRCIAITTVTETSYKETWPFP